MKSIALVLDLDNTLYCWMDSYAPGFDAQITYIAKRTGMTKKCIRESFKSVFQKHGSVEIVNAANELDIWAETNLTDTEIMDINEKSTALFLKVFADNLTLFPTVLETLEWAKERNILLFAFSDGRAFWINFRLKHLDIIDSFERIYVMEDEPADKGRSVLCKQMITLSADQIKPNTFILDEIMKDYHISKEDVYVVGDSKNKDIRTANIAGVNGIWAQYGMSYSQKSRHLLSSITPWTRSQRVRGRRIVPQYTITEFAEIKDIIRM